MSAIYSWGVADELNFKGPYIVKDGKYIRDQIYTVKKSDPPISQRTNDAGRKLYLVLHKGQLAEVIKSDYWGLTYSYTDTTKWFIVRLWVYASTPQIPKRTEYDTVNNGGAALYWMGTWANSANGDRMPKMLTYAEPGMNYRYIYKTNELGKFPLGSPSTGTTPPPSVGGGRGNNPGWDGTIPSTGPNSGTSITVGTNPPSSGDAQDIAWWLNYPPAPSTASSTNPGTPKPGDKDKGKGQWVTGPDGQRYYLPPGIDFAGLQREYDRTHPKPETKIVVRMPKGYASPVSTVDTKPRMTQRQLDLTESGQAIGTATETFVFPYIPQNIRYSDIGSQWQEIPRALNTSFVDWVGYKLMKVSMDFLVTARMQVGPVTTPNVVSDGLFNSVAEDLGRLRRMATNKSPVTLEGFDDILSVQMARSKSGGPRGIEFVIQDLNITAGRRTIDPDTGLATSPISNIAAAQVSLTLQEIPIESVTIVKLPPLNLGTPLIGKKEGGGGGGVPSLGLQSDLLTGLKWAVSEPPAGT